MSELESHVRVLRVRGSAPKQIARALGVRPSVVAALVRTIAQQTAAAAPEPEVVGCWVSAGWSEGLTVEGGPDWPDRSGQDVGASGLATVVVARRQRFDKVSACCYLVDVYCLGVKNAIPPRILDMRELGEFVRHCFSAYDSPPLAAPIDLAQHLVLGAIEYARALGFEPHPDFEAARGPLGSWTGPSAIGFGQHGTPMYVQGPYDDPHRVLRTLERSVGRGNFELIVMA